MSSARLSNHQVKQTLAGLALPRAYYKGTHLAFPTDDSHGFIKTVEADANWFIVERLRKGESFAYIASDFQRQLNAMEENLCSLQRNNTYPSFGTLKTHLAWADQAGRGVICPPTAPSGFATTCWFLAIAVLLKLKVIENDNDNGWLLIN